MFDKIYIHNLKRAYRRYAKASRYWHRYWSGKNQYYRAIKEWRQLTMWQRMYAVILVKIV